MGGLSVLTTATALVLALSLPLALPAGAQSVLGQREIEEGLTCQCGCGLTVATCNHLECSFAVPVRKEIAESLAKGQTGEQIIERFKVEYGEKVLSSPVPEGLNELVSGSRTGSICSGSALGAPSTQITGNGSPQ